MDDSMMQKTRQMFAMCDSDGDGVITKSELFKLVKELGYVWLTSSHLDALFSALYRELCALSHSAHDLTVIIVYRVMSNAHRLTNDCF